MASPKKKVTKSIAKVAGPVGQVISVIPDTAEVINQTIESAAPIVEKELDHRREEKKNFADVPNVVELNLNAALEHIENAGFIAQEVLAKPNQKYMDKRVGEVVEMMPKPTKPARIGSLVKIYYVDESVINKSGDVDLPDVVGLDIEKAKELIESLGFQFISRLAKPSPRYASSIIGTIVDAQPRRSVIRKTAKAGSSILVSYIDDQVLAISNELSHERKEKANQRAQAVSEGFSKARVMLQKKPKDE